MVLVRGDHDEVVEVRAIMREGKVKHVVESDAGNDALKAKRVCGVKLLLRRLAGLAHGTVFSQSTCVTKDSRRMSEGT